MFAYILHYVPKYMSCHKAIVVTTGKTERKRESERDGQRESIHIVYIFIYINALSLAEHLTALVTFYQITTHCGMIELDKRLFVLFVIFFRSSC